MKQSLIDRQRAEIEMLKESIAIHKSVRSPSLSTYKRTAATVSLMRTFTMHQRLARILDVQEGLWSTSWDRKTISKS